MLRVKIDIIPFGIEEDIRNISTIEIANIRTHDGNLADYGVEVNGKKAFNIKKFRRDDGALQLARLALSRITERKP